MPNKMLIDATHSEETRVVVLRGNRVEEFDFESANRKQLRGNIYLAKVTRVEPSLQAAFVDYGGNRHGFLAFSEIHPDYYQIPVADRQALLDDDARAHRDEEADHERRSGRRGRGGRNRGAHRRRDETVRSDPLAAEEAAREAAEIPAGENMPGEMPPPDNAAPPPSEARAESGGAESALAAGETGPAFTGETPQQDLQHDGTQDGTQAAAEGAEPAPEREAENGGAGRIHGGQDIVGQDIVGQDVNAQDVNAQDINAQDNGGEHGEEETVESVGGADAMEEVAERAPRYRRREYKIQEVIKRRQVMLVQVVKEERGTKGAALTTYLSLAGRYSVLMPNTARGGGISRKITSAEDRGRLKEIAQDLEVPEGMGVILRTAGASRTKTEVKRDFEYLLRLWETVRDLTLKSSAPKLVYEEGSLTKRSIRDLYNKDIDEIIVAGDEGYKDAKEFMRMLMPSHAKNVKLYKDTQPIFTRFGIESQLDAMFSPTVQLRSGGYIVLNQAEALVAIDVNSGRATREHHIEDTALQTNTEAAEEVARQLRLRDLAGLIVIDFIDMEEGRNNRTVERRLKESLKHDRARIQVGRISHFGLLEMSRQRIRTSVLESSTEKCPHCGGSGHVRSVSSVTLQLLRALEESLIKGPTHNLIVRTRSEVALYILNQKRSHLRALEDRFQLTITIMADPTVVGQISYVIDRGEQVHTVEQASALMAQTESAAPVVEEEEEEIIEDETIEAEPEATERADGETADSAYVESGSETLGDTVPREAGGGREDGAPRGRRRRRRGRRGGGEGREGGPVRQEGGGQTVQQAAQPGDFQSDEPGGVQAEGESRAAEPPHPGGPQELGPNGEVRRRRRRGRRGGRRNRQGREGGRDGGRDGGREGGAPYPAADIAAEPGTPHAAPDFHAAPPPARESAPSPRYEPPPPPPLPAASEPEPRRRSTIREPAPFAANPAPAPVSAPAPMPAPIVSSPQGEEPAQPKRGWWGKRIMGDKS